MSKTIKFNPTIPQRKENIYMEEFFSGADCNVYIDGKLCENVSGISFQLQEQLKPIYGYASRTYDDVAIGNRIVTGMIQIPVVSNEPAVTSICDYNPGTGNKTTEISSLPGASVPYNTNVFQIGSVPDWVSAWMAEYGYESVDSAAKDYNMSSNDIYTEAEIRSQRKLLALGYEVNPTGTMDADTQKAILSYQIANELNLSGVLDEETYNLLHGIQTEEVQTTFLPGAEVRTGPGTSYPVFHNPLDGESGFFMGEYNDYAKVRILDGRTGYVETKYIVEIIEGGI